MRDKMIRRVLTDGQRQMLIRRGLQPKNYWLIKETYTSLYLRDRRDGSLKILFKRN